MKSSTRVQPEATANYKCLFFLDVGQMPTAIQDQHSVPHGKLVANLSKFWTRWTMFIDVL